MNLFRTGDLPTACSNRPVCIQSATGSENDFRVVVVEEVALFLFLFLLAAAEAVASFFAGAAGAGGAVAVARGVGGGCALVSLTPPPPLLLLPFVFLAEAAAAGAGGGGTGTTSGAALCMLAWSTPPDAPPFLGGMMMLAVGHASCVVEAAQLAVFEACSAGWGVE